MGAVKGSNVVTETPSALSLARALERQRARTGRMLTRVRLVGVVTILALVVAVAYGAGQADWRVMVPVFGGLCGRRGGAGDRRCGARIGRRIWAGFGVALLDVPMVFVAQWLSMPVSPSPGGVAGFALGIFVLLVLLATLSLSRRQTTLVAAVSALGEVLLQREAGIRAGRLGGFDRRARLCGGDRGAPGRARAGAGRARRRGAAQARAARALLLAVGRRARCRTGARTAKPSPTRRS